MVVVVTILWKIREEWVEAKGECFDVRGLHPLRRGLHGRHVRAYRFPSPTGDFLFFRVSLGLFSFRRLGAQGRAPVLDMRLFMNSRVFLFSNLAA
jgi:hypothetical protein